LNTIVDDLLKALKESDGDSLFFGRHADTQLKTVRRHLITVATRINKVIISHSSGPPIDCCCVNPRGDFPFCIARLLMLPEDPATRGPPSGDNARQANGVEHMIPDNRTVLGIMCSNLADLVSVVVPCLASCRRIFWSYL
jgi:hypothetical protein